MTRRSQRHRSTALPYRYADSGLDFELREYSIDRSEFKELDLRPGQSEIDLTSVLSGNDDESEWDWQSVTLRGELKIPEQTIASVFPEHERRQPPAKLYVTIRCHETIYRDKVVLSESPTRAGTHDVEIELPKSSFRETIELRPYLVRTTTSKPEGGYASKKNFRVASGRIYRVVIDRAHDEEQPAIDGEPVNFSQVSHLPGGEKLYYLDFRNESRPKLWINSDHPRITEVLQSRGSVGAEPRMRDVILDEMSYGVWLQLLVRAGSAVDKRGEVEYEWQETVLQTFAQNLYDINDIEEATQRLRTDLNGLNSLPHIVSRIDAELQEYIDPRTQLINLMEEGLQI